MSKRPSSPVASEAVKDAKRIPDEAAEGSNEQSLPQAIDGYASVSSDDEVRALIEESDTKAAVSGTLKVQIMRRALLKWFKTAGANRFKVSLVMNSQQ
jgi:hypothetical protein